MVAGTNWIDTEEGKLALGNIHVEIPCPPGGRVTVIKGEYGTDFFVGFPVEEKKHYPALSGLWIIVNFIIGWLLYRITKKKA